MKKVFLIAIMGLVFFGLVSAATYPAPFTEGAVVNVAKSPPSSEEVTCKSMKGCWVDNECYPYGYRIEGQYCGLDRGFREKYKIEIYSILNQSKSDEFCENSFECKSSFCFKDGCVDTIKTVYEGVVRINKSDLEELRNIIESAETSMGKDYDEEVSNSFFSSLISLLKRIFGW